MTPLLDMKHWPDWILQEMLEVIKKPEVGQSVVWLLSTLLEDLWDNNKV